MANGKRGRRPGGGTRGRGGKQSSVVVAAAKKTWLWHRKPTADPVAGLQ
jgi:hypothetical protein